MAIDKRECTTCNSEFYGSSRARYCSNKCKQQSYRRVNRSKGFVYRLLQDDVVVYVGQSHNVKSMTLRIKTHKLKASGKVFNSWDFNEIIDGDLSEAEALEIISEKPMYNKSIPINDRYITVKRAVDLSDVFLRELIMDNCKVFNMDIDKRAKGIYVDSKSVEEFKQYIIEFSGFGKQVKQ